MITYFKNRSIITQVGVLFILLAVLWFLGFTGMMKNLIQTQLVTQAKTVVNNVQSLGQMIAGHGGIWVKAGEHYPHQFLERRDIGNGEFMYSKNPALVQREFSEAVHKNNFPASFRMTSLNVMNTANQPNSFELFALTEMQEAKRKGLTVEPIVKHSDGVFEYVEPVFHTKACLACHSDPETAPASVQKNYGKINGFGFKEGDLAGGISVKINYDESKMLTDIVDINLIALIVVPTIIFFVFIYLNTRKIGVLAKRISNYRRGESIGVDAKSIPENTSNEVGQLVKAVSKMVGIVEGTRAQLKSMEIASASKKSPQPGKPTN